MSLDYTCDYRFGFNTRPNRKGTVGYLLSWSGCGGLNLQPTIEVPNPFDQPTRVVVRGPTVRCVGLLESFQFAGEKDSPIRMVAYVSPTAAAGLQSKLLGTVTTTKLQVAWNIISFDTVTRQWYEAAYIQDKGNVTANLNTSKGELQVRIAPESTPIWEGVEIGVHRFEFEIIPAAGFKTTLQFATGFTQRLVRPWGGHS